MKYYYIEANSYSDSNVDIFRERFSFIIEASNKVRAKEDALAHIKSQLPNYYTSEEEDDIKIKFDEFYETTSDAMA